MLDVRRISRNQAADGLIDMLAHRHENGWHQREKQKDSAHTRLQVIQEITNQRLVNATVRTATTKYYENSFYY